ncbi:thioredoxin-like protein 1 [Tetranychus urticae]|uniref:PITH domain-containing protein n=1 Tax=Tetranychus urticae TaxID=32264 RepID=T1JRD6_TETUR|nr:thioredoxin-like protein 1 [Tetranychus urticae]
MGVIVVPDDSRFQVELTNAADSLAVVDFTASWCGPCQVIAPVFAQLSTKYPRAVFLKVDVDQCQESAHSQGVNAMPTFIFYRNKVKLATIQGANAAALEAKIKELIGDESGSGSSSSVPGHINLNSMLAKQDCECLNESDEHTLAGCLTPGSSTYLESDVDEQLIINLAFTQNVKLHSLQIAAPADKGPKTIKLFINQPRTLDFDQAESMEAVQTIQCTPKDFVEGALIPLRFVKFQNIRSLLIFVKDNQGGCETTRIDHLSVIGSPVTSTNLADLKRVAGKKGETH